MSQQERQNHATQTLALWLLAPVNHWFPGKVSAISFTLVNTWIDLPFIETVITSQPLPAEDDTHSLAGLLIIVTLIAMPGVRYAEWVIGAYLAALSHLLLDGIIHEGIQPFGWIEVNPLLVTDMQTLSLFLFLFLFLLPFMIWFIVQFASSCGDWVKKIGVKLSGIYKLKGKGSDPITKSDD